MNTKEQAISHVGDGFRGLRHRFLAAAMINTQSSDFIVIGGGIAGLIGANRAAELGLRVLALEQGADEHYACNSRYTGGIFHVCHRDILSPPGDLVSAIAKSTGGSADENLARALAADAARVYVWLKSQGIRFVQVAAINQRCVLAPPRINRAGLHWEGRGGDNLLRTLEANLISRGGNLIRGTRAKELVMADGRCVGVVAERGNQQMRIQAPAVLIADGGFQANPTMMREHISRHPERLMQRNAGTSVGDGIEMARAAGADLTGMQSGFYGHLLCGDAMEKEDLWPFPILDFIASAGIVVEATGVRFADEGSGGVFLANSIARLADPLSATVIFDHRIWEDRGRYRGIPPNPHLVLAGGNIHHDGTLVALAHDVGLPALELENTVKEYNDAIRDGRLGDLRIPRDESTYKAYPIEIPPFYAVRACAGVTFTMGGIRIDANGRVLRPNAKPIPGLFAAGSSTGGLDGGDKSGYVGGLIKAAVFGLRAAEFVCEMSERNKLGHLERRANT